VTDLLPLENLPLQLPEHVVPTRCMSVAYIETCSCDIKCYVSQQVDRQIRSDQLSTSITRSHRPWLLFLGDRIKDLVYHERPTMRDNMIRKISEVIRSLHAEEILRAINYF